MSGRGEHHALALVAVRQRLRMPAVIQLALISNHIALRENWQSYRGVPGQNSRSAPSLFQLTYPVFSDPVRPGITPFLPKTVKQRSGLALSGFNVDPQRKRILYAFCFTRNNAG